MSANEYENENRTHVISVRVTKEEHDRIIRNFKKSGCLTLSGYLRFVSLTAKIIRYTGDDIKRIRIDFHRIAEQINELAKRVNATGTLYPDDLKEIKEGVDNVWKRLIYIQSCLRLAEKEDD